MFYDILLQIFIVKWFTKSLLIRLRKLWFIILVTEFSFVLTDSISYNDFCDIMRKEKPPNEDSLLKAFKCIDKNGDGYITSDELFNLLTKVGHPFFSLLKIL